MKWYLRYRKLRDTYIEIAYICEIRIWLTLLYWPRTYFKIYGGALYKSGSSAETKRHFCKQSLRQFLHLHFKSSDEFGSIWSSSNRGKTFAAATYCACSGLCFPIWLIVQAVTERRVSSWDSWRICARITMALHPRTDNANWSEWPEKKTNF